MTYSKEEIMDAIQQEINALSKVSMFPMAKKRINARIEMLKEAKDFIEANYYG